MYFKWNCIWMNDFLEIDKTAWIDFPPISFNWAWTPLHAPTSTRTQEWSYNWMHNKWILPCLQSTKPQIYEKQGKVTADHILSLDDCFYIELVLTAESVSWKSFWVLQGIFLVLGALFKCLLWLYCWVSLEWFLLLLVRGLCVALLASFTDNSGCGKDTTQEEEEEQGQYHNLGVNWVVWLSIGLKERRNKGENNYASGQ